MESNNWDIDQALNDIGKFINENVIPIEGSQSFIREFDASLFDVSDAVYPDGDFDAELKEELMEADIKEVVAEILSEFQESKITRIMNDIQEAGPSTIQEVVTEKPDNDKGAEEIIDAVTINDLSNKGKAVADSRNVHNVGNIPNFQNAEEDDDVNDFDLFDIERNVTIPREFEELFETVNAMNPSQSQMVGDASQVNRNGPQIFIPEPNSIYDMNNQGPDSPMFNGELPSMPRKCDFCDEVFSFRQVYGIHLETKHPFSRLFGCKSCNLVFNNIQLFIHHVIRCYARMTFNIEHQEPTNNQGSNAKPRF